jgi:hypothetical protein
MLLFIFFVRYFYCETVYISLNGNSNSDCGSAINPCSSFALAYSNRGNSPYDLNKLIYINCV